MYLILSPLSYLYIGYPYIYLRTSIPGAIQSRCKILQSEYQTSNQNFLNDTSLKKFKICVFPYLTGIHIFLMMEVSSSQSHPFMILSEKGFPQMMRNPSIHRVFMVPRYLSADNCPLIHFMGQPACHFVRLGGPSLLRSAHFDIFSEILEKILFEIFRRSFMTILRDSFDALFKGYLYEDLNLVEIIMG